VTTSFIDVPTPVRGERGAGDGGGARRDQCCAGQAGLFTTEQAGAAGLYRQLLRSYVEHGRVRRVRRGIYRIVQAIEQAGARGLVGPDGLAEIARAMNPAEVAR
jgi:predicted transcriptional regulator of viral defense system